MSEEFKNKIVGRERELAALRKALTISRNGHGRMVMLLGEPGIGKTYLAESISHEAASAGTCTLWGRCGQTGAPAFWPWMQLLRGALSLWKMDWISAANRLWLERMLRTFPELGPMTEAWKIGESRTLQDSSQPQLSEAPELVRFRLFEAVSSFLGDFSAKVPLVLVIDDAQVADVDSLELLQFVARDYAQSRILILVTCLNVWSNIPSERSALLTSIARDADRFELQGLTDDEIIEFIGVKCGIKADEMLASRFQARTAGNPFYLDGLVQSLSDDRRASDLPEILGNLPAPDNTIAAIQHRLEPLAETTRRILTVASVMDGYFDESLLARVLGMPRDRVFLGLEEAYKLRLIRSERDEQKTYRFNHGLVAEAVRAEMTRAEIARLHKRVGEAIEVSTPDKKAGDLAQLAYHFGEALPYVPVSKAVEYAYRAARQVTPRAAYAEAIRLLRFALKTLATSEQPDQTTRCELLIELGEAQSKAGDQTAAQKSFEEGIRIAHDQQDSRLLARGTVGFAASSHKPGHADERSIANLTDSLNILGEKDLELRSLLLAQLAIELFWTTERERAVALSRQAVEFARRTCNPSILVWALWNLHRVLWGPDNVGDRLATAKEMVELAESHGDWDKAVISREFKIAALVELAKVDEIDREIESYGRLAEKTELASTSILRFRAMKSMLEGNFERAELDVMDLKKVADKRNDPDLKIAFAGQFGQLRGEQGRLQELEFILKQAAEAFPGFVTTRCGLALLYARLGRKLEAQTEFEYLADQEFHRVRKDWNWLGTIAILSEVCVFLEDRQRSQKLYQMLAPFAGRLATLGWADVCYGPVEHYLGLLAGSMGQFDLAERHFEHSIDLCLRISARPALARTQIHYAELLIANRLSNAKTHQLLYSAQETAKTLGMNDVLNRVEALNEKGAIKPPSVAHSGSLDGSSCLLFLDVVESHRLSEDLGDRAWRDLLHKIHRIAHQQVRKLGAKDLEEHQDGLLVIFPGVSTAIRAASAIRDSLARLRVVMRAAIYAPHQNVILSEAEGVLTQLRPKLFSKDIKNGILLVTILSAPPIDQVTHLIDTFELQTGSGTQTFYVFRVGEGT